MSYATVADMIDRFGMTEMIRLSEQEDRTATVVDNVKIQTALDDASVLADTYLRSRYKLPVAIPPRDLVRAICHLARFDLAQGARTEPTEQMRLSRKDIIVWLENIAGNKINIDAPSIGGGTDASHGARTSDRVGKADAGQLARL